MSTTENARALFEAEREVMKRKQLSKKIKRRLRERDGDRCAHCRSFFEKGEVTIEHVIPLSEGGTDDLNNLVLTHRRCNNARNNEIVTLTRTAFLANERAELAEADLAIAREALEQIGNADDYYAPLAVVARRALVRLSGTTKEPE